MSRVQLAAWAWGVFWSVVLAIVVAAAVKLLKSLRTSIEEENNHNREIGANFRHLRLRGELTDEEFRKVQATLDAQRKKGLVQEPSNSRPDLTNKP